MATLGEAFEVKETGPNTFIGKLPLGKPNPKSRGAYGGNIAGQAILVGLKAVPAGFSPNSFHSLFIRAVLDLTPLTWEVEENSNGKNFCSRTIRGVHDGQIKYVATISFTKNNSLKQAEIDHQKYMERKRQTIEGNIKDEDEGENDDLIQKPFYFLTPYPDWLKESNKHNLVHGREDSSLFLHHLFPRQLITLKGTEYEEEVSVTERKMSYFARIGDGSMKLEDPSLQFVAAAVISDAVFLTRLARVFRVPKADLKYSIPYFSVSLDHHMYFHDTDFDCTQWIGFSFRVVRFLNNRVLLEAEMYNSEGQHFATIFQEGLVHLNGMLEPKI